METRYELAPATRMLWREPDVVQFESGDRGVVVEGLTARTARSLIRGIVDEPDPGSRHALRTLADLGFLWPRDDDGDAGRRAAPNPNLAGELTALSTRRGAAAASVLHARRHASVTVHGAGRAGPLVGAVLAAAGVGHIGFNTETDVKLYSTLPGGVAPEECSQRFAPAARAAVRRAAPHADVSRRDGAPPADLAVLAVDEPIDDDRREALHRHGTPHLVIALLAGGAVIGPLVLPGLTSCLRCADLHRGDRDDAWPRLAVQLTVGRRYGPASEVAVATTAAGLAAMQALAFLDGEEPACIDGTLELRPPDYRVRRRSWSMHPDCGCAA